MRLIDPVCLKMAGRGITHIPGAALSKLPSAVRSCRQMTLSDATPPIHITINPHGRTGRRRRWFYNRPRWKSCGLLRQRQRQSNFVLTRL
ncbi:hypothetical protein CFBP6625_21740 [Agrobacterium tumefaciens]|nr:hypothetical protein CFBP6625_21740 [Agrobacterium tumefaciens]